MKRFKDYRVIVTAALTALFFRFILFDLRLLFNFFFFLLRLFFGFFFFLFY